MNIIFKPYLRKFVLVFFDDILVYSNSLSEHLTYLKLVFEVLSKHQLYAKKSKCCFGCSKIDYLGHLISKNGVRVDPKKLEAMLDWPLLTSLKSICEFLGLIGYYRKFIQNYSQIATLLKTPSIGQI